MTDLKLVRDRIPALLSEGGGSPVVELASGDQLLFWLLRKLQEECNEVIEDPSAEELADIVEVVRGIGGELGLSWDDIESARSDKERARGAFSKGFLLKVCD